MLAPTYNIRNIFKQPTRKILPDPGEPEVKKRYVGNASKDQRGTVSRMKMPPQRAYMRSMVTDTGAEAHALPASISGPSDEDNVYYVHEEVTLLSDHSSQGSMSPSGSLLAPMLAPRLDFKTCGLFDCPGHTPLQSDDKELEALPDHQTSEGTFDSILDPGSGSLQGTTFPPAFDVDPLIRNAYIMAFQFTVCHGLAEEAIEMYLDFVYETFISCQRRMGVKLRGLDTMARTLLGAEQRLCIVFKQYFV